MNVAHRLRTYGSLVTFSHTIFALPFAASAVVLSQAEPHVPLTVVRVALMLVCMVSARTAAMAYNRYADRDVDAENPRTRTRHLPSGAVRPGEALGLTVVAALCFLAAAAGLGFWPLVLSPVVLCVLLGYSLAKRFTWAAHVWLGVALSLAPGGAWLAAGARPNLGIVLLMLGVVTWLLGFDILYSLQDETFDRARGLHSIPARFGTRGAVLFSALAHVATVLAFAGAGFALGRGPFFFTGVVARAGILVYEHWIVGPGRLDRINKAFFDLNAYVSVAFFVLTLLDGLTRHA